MNQREVGAHRPMLPINRGDMVSLGILSRAQGPACRATRCNSGAPPSSSIAYPSCGTSYWTHCNGETGLEYTRLGRNSPNGVHVPLLATLNYRKSSGVRCRSIDHHGQLGFGPRGERMVARGRGGKEAFAYSPQSPSPLQPHLCPMLNFCSVVIPLLVPYQDQILLTRLQRRYRLKMGARHSALHHTYTSTVPCGLGA